MNEENDRKRQLELGVGDPVDNVIGDPQHTDKKSKPLEHSALSLPVDPDSAADSSLTDEKSASQQMPPPGFVPPVIPFVGMMPNPYHPMYGMIPAIPQQPPPMDAPGQHQAEEGPAKEDANKQKQEPQAPNNNMVPMFMPPGVQPVQMGHMNPFMMQPGNPAMPGQMMFQPFPPMFPPPSIPTCSRGIQISLGCDQEHLSEYQILVRRQLELFEASAEDMESSTQGRKKKVVIGQVGLRCRHCAAFPLRARGRGAVYYPSKLEHMYQASQNMSSTHLCNSCLHMAPALKEQLRRLRSRRDNANGGKKYWADGFRVLGLYETENGLKMKKSADDSDTPEDDFISAAGDSIAMPPPAPVLPPVVEDISRTIPEIEQQI